MLYHIGLHLNPVYLTVALSIATAIIITLVKEKRDERKRA